MICLGLEPVPTGASCPGNDMVRVFGGVYPMGSARADSQRDEGPFRSITIVSSFCLDIHEVTNERYVVWRRPSSKWQLQLALQVLRVCSRNQPHHRRRNLCLVLRPRLRPLGLPQGKPHVSRPASVGPSPALAFPLPRRRSTRRWRTWRRGGGASRARPGAIPRAPGAASRAARATPSCTSPTPMPRSARPT